MKKRNVIIIGVVFFTIILSGLIAIRISANRTYDRKNPRSKPNSYYLSETVKIDLPIDEVFSFVTYEDQNVWHKVAREHQGQHYEIINADGLTKGAIVICKEFADGEGTSHRYVVKESIENKLIHLASEPSIVYYEDKNGDMKKATTCNSYVYFDMEPDGEGKTKLSQSLCIQMPNFFTKFITDMIGGDEGKAVWQHHLREELEGLAYYMTDTSGKEFLDE